MKQLSISYSSCSAQFDLYRSMETKTGQLTHNKEFDVFLEELQSFKNLMNSHRCIGKYHEEKYIVGQVQGSESFVRINKLAF